jgi:hypothetical protein
VRNLARFNVDFSDEANAVLEDLAGRQKTTKAEVIRKAIALEKWFSDTTRDGSKIVVEAPDGKLREVLKF